MRWNIFIWQCCPAPPPAVPGFQHHGHNQISNSSDRRTGSLLYAPCSRLIGGEFKACVLPHRPSSVSLPPAVLSSHSPHKPVTPAQTSHYGDPHPLVLFYHCSPFSSYYCYHHHHHRHYPSGPHLLRISIPQDGRRAQPAVYLSRRLLRRRCLFHTVVTSTRHGAVPTGQEAEVVGPGTPRAQDHSAAAQESEDRRREGATPDRTDQAESRSSSQLEGAQATRDRDTRRRTRESERRTRSIPQTSRPAAVQHRPTRSPPLYR